MAYVHARAAFSVTRPLAGFLLSVPALSGLFAVGVALEICLLRAIMAALGFRVDEMNEIGLQQRWEFVPGDTKKWGNRIVHRIRALVDMPEYAVKSGDIGGYIEHAGNLPGDSGGWVGGKAVVCANAVVAGRALVFESAVLAGNAVATGEARIGGDAWVFGGAFVGGRADVHGCAWIYDDASVLGRSCVYGNAQVFGSARVYGRAQVFGFAHVYGNARISGDARAHGHALVAGLTHISGTARVGGRSKIIGSYVISSGLYGGKK